MTADVVCASGAELLMEYLEGALAPEVQAELEAHVADCPRCVAFLASYRATPRILRRATLATLPEDLGDSLLAFLRRPRA